MRNIIYALLGVFTLVLTSCEKNDIFESEDSNLNNTEFTFILSTDDVYSEDLQSRSDSEAVPNRWIMEVWDETGKYKVHCFGPNFDSHRSENSYGEFTLTLDKTKIYTCLFWADNGTAKTGSLTGSNLTYNADNLKAITLATGIERHTKDAYFANVMVNGSGASQTIKLKRAVAELRLVETGINPDQDITVMYQAYNTFNIATRSAASRDSISSSHILLESEFAISGDEKRLGSFLTFATDSKLGISIDFTIKENARGRIMTIRGVKLQSNEVTNIKGYFFENIEIIKSINAITKPDNALRVDINIEFGKAVEYYIEYWKSDNKASKIISKSKKSEEKLSETLVLLEPETKYSFKVFAYDNLYSVESNVYNFTTNALPGDISSMLMEQNKLKEELPGYILQTTYLVPNYITIFNMQGVMLWYQDMGKHIEVATFDAKTGTIASIVGTGSTDDPLVKTQEIVVLDLMGKQLLRKTFTDLYAHHDIRRMPDGNIIVVNFVPKVFDLRQHGGEVDDIVWGDGYTIMDMSGEIITEWDCFEELNPLDDPEIVKTKGDWLHANSVNFDPQGNIYMSFMWSSELWKIKKTSGEVLYRIGKNGNMNILESGYTSGIHTLIPLESNKILMLDNGNTNNITRAMIYEIDEEAKKVEVTLNVSLPSKYHTKFMGNVDIIGDDLLMFNSSMSNSVVFTNYKGDVVRVLKLDKYMAYRSIYIPEIKY